MPLTPTPFNREDEQLNLFYGERWQHRDHSMDLYEYSGYILGEQIRTGERVLHVNCGSNPFKGMIANLHAFDPENANAEYKISLEQYFTAYRSQKFNVALCLNAFDNGDEEYIQRQIALIMQMMVKRDARIYWRTSTIGTYPWTFDAHTRLSTLFDYRVAGMCYDHNNTIYAEWNSNNTTLNLQG